MHRLRQIIIFVFLLISVGCVFAQSKTTGYANPKTKKGEQVICHQAYCFVYSESHEQAKWVAYKLTSDMLESAVKRNNKFILDPEVITETANNKDYKGSGYDKGHLAPAADMCFSQIAMEESFYFSNISPQDPGFNRGIWKSLEKETREYAKKLDKVYITTGPVLKDGLIEIGENKVDVPEEYYKAILYISDTCIEAIAFVLPNKKIDSDKLFQYAVSIDKLEKTIDLNLYHKLPFLIEKRTEKNLNIQFWQNLIP